MIKRIEYMRKVLVLLVLVMGVVLGGCSGKGGAKTATADEAEAGASVEVKVKYATGFTVRDTAGIRLVDVGKHYHFALVKGDVAVPQGYTKIQVPIERTICMTALQLSNFTSQSAGDLYLAFEAWRL